MIWTRVWWLGSFWHRRRACCRWQRTMTWCAVGWVEGGAIDFLIPLTPSLRSPCAPFSGASSLRPPFRASGHMFYRHASAAAIVGIISLRFCLIGKFFIYLFFGGLFFFFKRFFIYLFIYFFTRCLPVSSRHLRRQQPFPMSSDHRPSSLVVCSDFGSTVLQQWAAVTRRRTKR